MCVFDRALSVKISDKLFNRTSRIWLNFSRRREIDDSLTNLYPNVKIIV